MRCRRWEPHEHPQTRPLSFSWSTTLMSAAWQAQTCRSPIFSLCAVLPVVRQRGRAHTGEAQGRPLLHAMLDEPQLVSSTCGSVLGMCAAPVACRAPAGSHSGAKQGEVMRGPASDEHRAASLPTPKPSTLPARQRRTAHGQGTSPRKARARGKQEAEAGCAAITAHGPGRRGLPGCSSTLTADVTPLDKRHRRGFELRLRSFARQGTAAVSYACFLRCVGIYMTLPRKKLLKHFNLDQAGIGWMA